MWTSDIPRDLTVDGVWFIQAKYDSTCVLNTSPGSLVDELLVDHTLDARMSWFEEVALDQLQAYYAQVRAQLPLTELPTDVRDLDKAAKALLKQAMRANASAPTEDDAYRALCRAVSIETTLRWRHRLGAASLPQRTQMLFRMLRIAGGPYWLLGTKGSTPVQLRISDTRTWRDRFELKRFTVVDAHAGQPQVDWRAEVLDRVSGARRADRRLLRDPMVARQVAGQPRVQGAGDHPAPRDPRLRAHVNAQAIGRAVPLHVVELRRHEVGVLVGVRVLADDGTRTRGCTRGSGRGTAVGRGRRGTRRALRTAPSDPPGGSTAHGTCRAAWRT